MIEERHHVATKRCFKSTKTVWSKQQLKNPEIVASLSLWQPSNRQVV